MVAITGTVKRMTYIFLDKSQERLNMFMFLDLERLNEALTAAKNMTGAKKTHFVLSSQPIMHLGSVPIRSRCSKMFRPRVMKGIPQP